ncbi:DUF4767 domain-containing protein [Facklamia miroungae]|uniref:DUF4767 domain-containing protein n=1 Tax=Facklamia miroungae TaxID=120956 RepID=A0A1G7STF8_9LACT|nr:DUF4767 domain-containing protein [Facklamia miroungae]NKZ29543.1 DUF4767 domain-containing protein [Facklamia miroungae]SDG26313.1 protein of unknown function [Facklamia miroungae]
MKKVFILASFLITSFSTVAFIKEPAEGVYAQNVASVSIDKEVNIQDVRQAMKQWQEVVQTYSLEKPKYTIASLQAMGPAEFDQSYHWIISDLYQAYYTNLMDYSSQEEKGASIGNLREVLSHSFGLEKMLLPELSRADQDALNQLRLYIVSAIMEFYQEGIHDKLPGFFTVEGTDFAAYIDKYLALDDQHLDQLIRISLASSFAPEAYSFSFDEEMFNIPEELAYPSEQYEMYTITNGVFVQDVGGTTPYYFHVPTGEITEGHLASPDLHPLVSYNWSEVYGREIKNYYPAYQTQAIQTNAKKYPSDWTADQSQELVKAVKNWEVKMGQKYEFVTSATPLNFLGGDLPLKSMIISLDGQERKAYYQADQVKDNEINILMAMTDIRDQENPKPERHFYLFVEDKGQARVLITMEGPDESAIHHFKDTANSALDQIFKTIY